MSFLLLFTKIESFSCRTTEIVSQQFAWLVFSERNGPRKWNKIFLTFCGLVLVFFAIWQTGISIRLKTSMCFFVKLEFRWLIRNSLTFGVDSWWRKARLLHRQLNFITCFQTWHFSLEHRDSFDSRQSHHLKESIIEKKLCNTRGSCQKLKIKRFPVKKSIFLKKKWLCQSEEQFKRYLNELYQIK